MAPLLTIDFEASCLPRDGRSFPIEVGVADLSGWSRSWLIRPEPQWAGWTWTDEAQQLHGIRRDCLDSEGWPASRVMSELNAIARGRQVVSDHDLDRGWLVTLAAAAGVPPEFGIGHVAELLDRYGPTAAEVRRAIDAADRRVPSRHRAGPDAAWLALVIAGLARDARQPPLFGWTMSPASLDHATA